MNVEIEGRPIKISHPEKLLWPDIGIRKIDYIRVLAEIAPYMLPHTADKELTAIRYPDGVEGEFFYQKRPPQGTPEWADIINDNGDTFINLKSLPMLVLLGNLAVVEFHTPFCKYTDGMLRSLVFDLDPSKGQSFADAALCAIRVHETLEELGIESLVKTSGASGLQIYIPIGSMTFERGRSINEFFGKYFAEKYPDLMTIERQVKKRGKKLYFDYMQMWRGKNIISVYSPRAISCGAVSMPVTWEELEAGVDPCAFNLKNVVQRLNDRGDMFKKLLHENKTGPGLQEILKVLALD